MSFEGLKRTYSDGSQLSKSENSGQERRCPSQTPRRDPIPRANVTQRTSVPTKISTSFLSRHAYGSAPVQRRDAIMKKTIRSSRLGRSHRRESSWCHLPPFPCGPDEVATSN